MVCAKDLDEGKGRPMNSSEQAYMQSNGAAFRTSLIIYIYFNSFWIILKQHDIIMFITIISVFTKYLNVQGIVLVSLGKGERNIK